MIGCTRFFISGRVQGVGYRFGAQQAARRLGATGWVRNLSDSRVEVYACADAPALGALEAWLRQGPVGAEVTAVTRANADEGEGRGTVGGFQIRATE